MNVVLAIFCILVQLEAPLAPPSLEAAEPADLEVKLARQGISVLQTIDVQTSAISPLPTLRETIRLPLPPDTRIFVVDGRHHAFDTMFAVRLQPDGGTRSIDGFARGRMLVVGVSRSLKKRYNDVLRHELVHAYLNVVAPKRDLPPWLEEGLACYFSGSPSHLNHRTYRLYERDMRYLFATHADGMPRFLADAMTSSDASQALFLHFRIPSAVHLHLMRLSWENAFWMALVLVPVLTALFARFLSELLYPWYVGWRRRYLSWRYCQAVGRLERDLGQHLPPQAATFLVGARKAASLAHNAHVSVSHASRWSQELGERLWSSASRLIREIAPYVRGFGVHGGWCAENLERMWSFSDAVEKLMAADLSEEETTSRTKELFDRVGQSSEAMAALARSVFHGPWLEPAQECMEASVEWRRDRDDLERAVLKAHRDKMALQCQLVELTQYKIDRPARKHPLEEYSVTVTEALLAWRRHAATLLEAAKSLREGEKNLLHDLQQRAQDTWLNHILESKMRLDDLITACAEPEHHRQAEFRRLARLWGRQDFVPRVRRDGTARWLRPPDVLEMACFFLFFVAFVAGWTSLRRLCAFFLLGLDRLLGG